MITDSNLEHLPAATKRFGFRPKARTMPVDSRFLSRASLLLGALATLALISASLNFRLENPKSWLFSGVLVVAGGACAGAWQSSRKGNLTLAAILLVGGAIVANTLFFVLGSDASFLETLCVFMLVAVLAMLTLGVKVAYAVIIWSNLATVYLWLANGIFLDKNGSDVAYKLGVDDLTMLVWVQLLTIWLVNYLVRKLVQANQTAATQAAQLAEALADIEKKRQLGEEMSQRVFAMTAQLHATANQQASGSQEQADALKEVVAFIQELTQTSQLIAGEANQLREATQIISNSTRQARAASFEVKQMSETSALAVNQTTALNEQVNELYHNLHKTLTELAHSQDEIRQVVRLIQDLGKQTHLLALNAALEAASAGEYGDRFGIVAQEVKALSDNSIRASHQVSEILGFVENRIEQATQVAQSGYEQTQSALAVAQDSGTLMRQLVTIIETNNQEMERIEEAAHQMSTQASEISLETNQQYGASIQGVEKLRLIGTIATQSASGSVQVTSSTHSLEELARQLLVALR